MNTAPSIVSTDHLVENYDAIAFDSYGVIWSTVSIRCLVRLS